MSAAVPSGKLGHTERQQQEKEKITETGCASPLPRQCQSSKLHPKSLSQSQSPVRNPIPNPSPSHSPSPQSQPLSHFLRPGPGCLIKYMSTFEATGKLATGIQATNDGDGDDDDVDEAVA
ncbi:hypothetical protein ACLKA6_008193 [Drosophila palustris]